MKPSNTPLCRYFMNNACYKGSECPFSHDRHSKPDMTCRYYLQGNCAYGSRCRSVDFYIQYYNQNEGYIRAKIWIYIYGELEFDK